MGSTPVKVIVAVPGRGADFFGVVGKAGLYDKPASLRLPKGEIGDVRFMASISIR